MPGRKRLDVGLELQQRLRSSEEVTFEVFHSALVELYASQEDNLPNFQVLGHNKQPRFRFSGS